MPNKKTGKKKVIKIPDEPNTPQTIQEEYLNVGPEDGEPEWITVAEFIRRARQIHGNKYGYSLVRGIKFEDIPHH